ncbi:MAG: hypothetical protein HYS53_00025 [Candidatus Aenigmarchaeota archaeon]|nr:hypothetical protein [Candidatus Aenigmarchaeota archaeon]
MAMFSGVTTSEWWRVAHPDAVSRRLGEELYLSAYEQDPDTRADIKVLVGPGKGENKMTVHFSGQIKTGAEAPDTEEITRRILDHAGYADYGVEVIDGLAKQSVTLGRNGGAGDSRAIYGYYAVNPLDRESGLSLSHWMAREISRRLDGYPNLGAYPFDWMMPDGKVQVTASGQEIYCIAVSVQHRNSASVEHVRDDVRGLLEPVLKRCDDAGIRCDRAGVIVNGAGPFHEGASNADTGNGNKDGNIFLGGACPQTDLEFYGRDPAKPDRSGTLWLRRVCRELAYNFGFNEVSAHSPWVLGQERAGIFVGVPMHRAGLIEHANDYARKFAVSLPEIIDRLGLKKLPASVYRQAAVWGPYGRQFSWDR